MYNRSNNENDLKDLESIKIMLASPETIRGWSSGEVLNEETINYRTYKPEEGGLFCEKIFGPTKDNECRCGKYKKAKYRGMVCDKCGVEITKSKVRRERMGHIELAAPVSHIWYFRGSPSRIAVCLGLSNKDVEKVLYYAAYIVTKPLYQLNSDGTVLVNEKGEKQPVQGLEYKTLLKEDEYRKLKVEYGDQFEAYMGGEGIKRLLEDVNLEEESKRLKKELSEINEKQKNSKQNKESQKKQKIIKQLEVIEAFRLSGNRPEWMMLTVLPVIPPDLRPMVQLDGGRFATSDLNDLYRHVISRNKRLKEQLLKNNTPDSILNNEKRMLQDAVDALIDNGKHGKGVQGSSGKASKSLSEMLKGKQGRFRQNLLGKRVDFSGRSVIVVGPELKFYQCGLPKPMAVELFKPFIMEALVRKGKATNIKQARKLVEAEDAVVWEVIEEVIHERPVMLNRAPTLHRLSIQAFEPVLVEGKAIKLHPLVCTGFNADFDGDQMAVHVPLTEEAQAEARFLMLSPNNILAPKDGTPITTPTQDMILGSYYLTYPGISRKETEDGKIIEKLDDFKDLDGFKRVPEMGDGKVFTDMDEMMMAYQTGVVSIHARVKVRRYLDKNDKTGKLVESTVGRFIFNEGIPQDLGFVDRQKDKYSLEVDWLCGKKELGYIIDKCFRKHRNTGTVLMLDYIKATGFKYSTKAAISISISDMEVPKEKEEIVSKADAIVKKYENAYRNGFITDKERYKMVCDTWNKATDEVSNVLMASLSPLNNLQIMAHSGARGNKKQISQIGGMRGLMATAKGETVEIPIRSNFRQGLSILEYFISANGARKGLTDTALRTADSGYLTRRLVDVSHNLVIREEDCGTDEYIIARAFVEKDKNAEDKVIESLSDRINGRTAARDIIDPSTGEVLVQRNELISVDMAKKIKDLGIKEVPVRSILTCHAKSGLCAKCYGKNLATDEPVNIGEAVGTIAAQSIGEPGTQLTMRTFHTGGVANAADITGGLPRVEELLEARTPKQGAKLALKAGEVIDIEENDSSQNTITVRDQEGNEEKYDIPHGKDIIVSVGEKVEAGDPLTSGSLDPKQIFKLKGADAVRDYIVLEVQKVYKEQGVDINDKHIEIIVSQLLSKYQIDDAGDTNLIPGALYDLSEITDENERVKLEGKNPAKFTRIIRGISKASLATPSFLSAASFQETTKVLTDAATKGKIDRLVGLKENVILGRVIPAGTGLSYYRNREVDYKDHEEEINSWNQDVQKGKVAYNDTEEESYQEEINEALGQFE